LSRYDLNHRAAAETFAELGRMDDLFTHNYIVVETTALVERRLGHEDVRKLHTKLLQPIEVAWVDPDTHALAGSAKLATARSSFVDRVSFELMRRLRVDRAFAFDRDFAAEGFEVVP
jgi:predicted nucleic acid-binding protein